MASSRKAQQAPKGDRQHMEEIQWLRQALNMAQAAMYEWDVQNGHINWSDNTATILGLPELDKVTSASTFEKLIHEKQRDKICKKRLNGSAPDFVLEYSLTLPNGRELHIQENGHQVCDEKGNIIRLMGMLNPKAMSASDISNSALIESVYEEEYHYPSSFMDALKNHLLQYRKRDDHAGALIIISIDNMPMIVNGHGNTQAELIVNAIKKDIAAQVAPKGEIFRIQRDQYAIIAPETKPNKINRLTREMLNHIKGFGVRSDISPLHVVPSIGYALFHTCEQNATSDFCMEVIDKAYIALKSNTLFQHSYQDEVLDNQSTSMKEMEMANYIHTALHENKLRLAYQPIVDAKTGDVAHYECLLRLKGDDGSITSAGALIPVAERMGLIDVIDQLVLEMVVEDLLRSPDLKLAFNVSNLTTNDPEWLDMFVRILEASPEIAPRMTIEITETASHRDMKETAYFVASLQALGCKVALDDFGSGFTSFRQLKSLSCDLIKIDGSFVRDIESNADNRFFVKTLLDFTHGFGLKSVAEMVENGESAKILMDLGVDYMQGYYFGKPEIRRAWLDDKK